jgi:hypothetical protein
MLDKSGGEAEHDIKFYSCFHDPFKKEFKWEVPNTCVNQTSLFINLNDLPVDLKYKQTHIGIKGVFGKASIRE